MNKPQAKSYVDYVEAKWWVMYSHPEITQGMIEDFGNFIHTHQEYLSQDTLFTMTDEWNDWNGITPEQKAVLNVFLEEFVGPQLDDHGEHFREVTFRYWW